MKDFSLLQFVSVKRNATYVHCRMEISRRKKASRITRLVSQQWKYTTALITYQRTYEIFFTTTVPVKYLTQLPMKFTHILSTETFHKRQTSAYFINRPRQVESRKVITLRIPTSPVHFITAKFWTKSLLGYIYRPRMFHTYLHLLLPTRSLIRHSV